MSTYKGKALGAIGHLGAFSFHETKNVISGEGRALLINDERFVEQAEVIREKGTNRRKFYRGEVDKYTWVDIGSSYLSGEIIAAFLWAQLQEAEAITNERLTIWNQYHNELAEFEQKGLLRRPIIPAHTIHNAHMYYILLESLEERTNVINRMKKKEINPVFHYVPLHNSPAGLKYGRAHGSLLVTEDLADRLLRLPLWMGMQEVKAVCAAIFGREKIWTHFERTHFERIKSRSAA